MGRRLWVPGLLVQTCAWPTLAGSHPPSQYRDMETPPGAHPLLVRLAPDIVNGLDAWIASRPEPRPDQGKAIDLALRDWLIGLGLIPFHDDPDQAKLPPPFRGSVPRVPLPSSAPETAQIIGSQLAHMIKRAEAADLQALAYYLEVAKIEADKAATL